VTPSYTALTWDHPRGYGALRAAAAEVAPGQGLSIGWDTHSLEGFESHPIADLCARYDLVVLDHPHVGEAVEAGCLVPLEDVFGVDELKALADATIGPCFSSYRYAEKHWALPLDAATQVMAYRPDRSSVVQTWDEVVAEAEKGGVALSLAGPHAVLSYLSICAAFGEPPAVRDPRLLVSEATGARGFELLARIYAKSEKTVLALNPIGILEHMGQHDDVRLAPLVYGYVNYTRRDIRFADAPRGPGGIGSTLGGTGIGISTRCEITPQLLAHLRWLLSEAAQRDFIPAHDGQPSRRSAWHNANLNATWGDFYAATAATLEAAYVRPRYAGYIAWQSAASAYLRQALVDGLDGGEVTRTLNRMHQDRIGDRQR
jgi:multiple sugar transport system substrate-binding protein